MSNRAKITLYFAVVLVRLVLTALLVRAVYHETGWATALFAALTALYIEVSSTRERVRESRERMRSLGLR